MSVLRARRDSGARALWLRLDGVDKRALVYGRRFPRRTRPVQLIADDGARVALRGLVGAQALRQLFRSRLRDAPTPVRATPFRPAHLLFNLPLVIEGVLSDYSFDAASKRSGPQDRA